MGNFFTDLGTKLIPKTRFNQAPLVSPQPKKVVGNAQDMKLTVNKPKVSKVQAATAKPTPMPSIAPGTDPNFRYTYEKHKNTSGFQPAQPPKIISDIIRKHFPNEATTAGLLAATENARYDPKADGKNTDGSIDRGIFQINSNTFNGLRARKTKQMDAAGITSFDQMYDPDLNAKVGRMVYDEGGLGRWYGWQDKGYDLMGGKFTHPKLRGSNKKR